MKRNHTPQSLLHTSQDSSGDADVACKVRPVLLVFCSGDDATNLFGLRDYIHLDDLAEGLLVAMYNL